jgi:glyoxylase-like metal-dependent hydrolase (beta-lactamase superfamily II)
MLEKKQIINEPVSSNCYLLYNMAVGRECIIVDPGSKSDDVVVAFINNNNLIPKYIVLTHEHFDHCWGVNELVERYHIPVVCSELCAECIKYEKRNCSVFYDNKERFVITSKTISVKSLNYVLPFGGSELRFFDSPGHTNASICIAVGQSLFTGDTLIKDLRTVTKLPTGSVAKLQQTKDVLHGLQGKGYIVYPGHGDVFELDGYDLDLMFKGEIPK